MTEQQKRAATAVSLVVIIVVSTLLLILAYAVFFTTGSLGNRFPGRQFMLVVHSWSVLGIALKTLPPIVSIGVAIFVRYKLRDWVFYAVLTLSAAGAVAALLLLLEVASIDTARRFWAYSPADGLDDFASFASAAQTALGAIILWLVGVFGLQLGLKPRGAG
jgi:hypothetical protein